MPMDGLTIGFLARELHATLAGGRVERVQQPERDELLLTIRSGGANHRLLLSTSANHARVHLTQEPRENPAQPPMFCMLLRKRLTGARVQAVEQPTADRVLHIRFETVGELGDPETQTLIAEIMGRHSNLIFVGESGRIIDSVKRVTSDISRVREVLPGLPYVPPPVQNKIDTKAWTREDCDALFRAETAAPLSRFLAANLSGLSPVAAREIAFRLAPEDPALDALDGAAREALSRRLFDFFAGLPEMARPTLLLNDESLPLDVFAFEYRTFDAGHQHPQESLSKAVDAFFRLRDRAERIRQRSAALTHTITQHLERALKKAAIQRDTIAQGEKMDQYRQYGDLIMSNMHRLTRGDRVAKVEDFYAEGAPMVEIPLEATLGPSENAQRYYKRYSKAKAGVSAATKQLEATLSDIEWLEAELHNVSKCVHMAELDEIRQELVREGFVRPTSREKGKKAVKVPASKPYRYQSRDGHTIWVGKNNLQNDRLTAKADPMDIWLHAKDMPGSHVILELKSGALTDEALAEAALLAAYYSKGRGSANVPVDYCERRYVKKPGGAKPGYVIFTHNRTLYITPEEGAVRAIRLVEE